MSFCPHIPIRYHPKSLIPKFIGDEWMAIARSADTARANYWNQGGDKRAQYSKQMATLTSALESASIDEIALAFMAWPGNRRLNKGRWRKVVDAALDRNDTQFLIRLGKALESQNSLPPMEKLPALLIGHWCETDSKAPSLCFFSDSALAGLADQVFGINTFNADQIRRVRERLELVRASRIQIHSVVPKGGMILAKQVNK